MGEPGGVGAEITVSAWRALKASGPVFFVIGNAAELANAGAHISEINTPSRAAAAFSTALPVLPIDTPVKATPGEASPKNAGAVLESIKRAVAFATSDAVDGIVTNPIQKLSLFEAGFKFPGHTEFLEALTNDAPMPPDRTRGAVMMLVGPQLRTVPVTIHMSIKDAIGALTPDLIVNKAMITAEALKHDFGVSDPRLVISGLNPHAGEGGALGMEDDLIIAPAIDQLQAAGIDARGPFSADTMFHEEARATYDAALCMLHDQALIPAKTLAFYDAVNVTLGLPIIRTSPDHGVALDIAGKGLARADSLIAAIRIAAAMAARRRAASS